MTTLQDEWRKFRDQVYPQGIPPQQNIECHQAFFAGAFAIGVVIMEATQKDQPEEEAAQRVAKLIEEAEKVCKNRVEMLKGRN